MIELPGDGYVADVSRESLSLTTLGDLKPGSPVNLEVDVIARYLERLMQGDAAAHPGAGSLSMETLAENGFLKS